MWASLPRPSAAARHGIRSDSRSVQKTSGNMLKHIVLITVHNFLIFVGLKISHRVYITPYGCSIETISSGVHTIYRKPLQCSSYRFWETLALRQVALSYLNNPSLVGYIESMKTSITFLAFTVNAS